MKPNFCIANKHRSKGRRRLLQAAITAMRNGNHPGALGCLIVAVDGAEQSEIGRVEANHTFNPDYGCELCYEHIKDHIETGKALAAAKAEIDRLRASISVDDIMESDIEAVEEEIGIGRGAWDMVDHRELIMACVKMVYRKYA